MVRATATGLALAFLFVTLAGCGGPSETTTLATDTPYTPAEQGHTEETGSIVGYVVDEEHLPLEGALVGFVEPYIADTTDATGAFEIGQLTPGKWALYVIHLGHKADGLMVTVTPGEATKVTFVLPVLPVEVAWTETKIASGSFSYSIVTKPWGLSFSPGNATADFQTSDRSEAVTGVVVALEWESTQGAADSGLRLRASVPEARSSSLGEFAGVDSPLIGVLDDEAVAKIQTARWDRCGGEDPCTIRTTTSVNPALLGTPADVGFALEQRYDVHTSFFYRMPVPDGFSPVPP